MLVRLLVATRPRAAGQRIAQLLAQDDVLVADAAATGRTLIERAEKVDSDVVVVSRAMLPRTASAAIANLRALPDRPEVVVLVDDEDPADRASLSAAGALEVVNQALPDDVLLGTLRTSIERRREEMKRRLLARPGRTDSRLADFVSKSAAMAHFTEIARRVVPSDSSLLILGETGVGKERLAQAIHAEGPRAAGPFVAVNCGALPETLLESELFGHEAGAFTGAHRARRGFFELAHRGTVFLDEVAEMPPHLQVRLLRVLQERKIQRLGSEAPIDVDVRVIAATNRDLGERMRSGQFRTDLYYRLAVVTLAVPPLRERREDIPDLVESYVSHLAPRLGRRVGGVDTDALAVLCEYAWPGNVRELINVLERALLLCEGEAITLRELPDGMAANAVARAPGGGSAAAAAAVNATVANAAAWADLPLWQARQHCVEDFERRYLTELLARSHGRIGDAARRAGLNPRSLFEKMRRHGLKKEAFRVREQG